MHGLGNLLKAADAIPCSKQAGNIGSAILVHLDKASLQLGAQLAGHIRAVGSTKGDEETIHC